MKIFILLIFIILSNILVIFSQNEYQIRPIANNLDTPWEILWGPDNNIWFTERYGRISKVDPITGKITSLIKIDEVIEDGERGLMGLVLHPNFFKEPYVYTVYNTGFDNPTTRIKIVRYTYDGEKLISPYVLMDNIKGWWNHDGARLWITDDLKLLVTIGDAADISTPQNLNSLNGKILRMNLDGSIPSDNPFPNSYVYSFGHRNPQGLVVSNGKIYSSEHGPSTDDEINIILAGRNYGWPEVNGYCNTEKEKDFCKKNNVVEPIISLTPQATLAICGIDYYQHNLIPEWNNSLLVTALKDQRLVQLKLNEQGDSVLLRKDFFTWEFGRLRDVCISPDGKVYLATSNKDGRGTPKINDDKILEITPIATNVKKNDNLSTLIFPNPTNDNINIVLNNSVEEFELEIYNYLGKLKINNKYNQNYIQINLKEIDNIGLEKGIYFLVLKFTDNIIFEKIVLN
jgi:glucose/arabinose dehydrogenase